MGFFDFLGGMGGMGAGLLGLGLAGDAFSAYSNYRNQQRMRDLYKRMQDPNYIMGQAQQYYGQNMNQLRQALPQLERTSIDPQIAQRGISGGAAQALYDQTVAGYQQNAWQNALQQAAGGLQNAAQVTGQPMGQGGNTANMLQSLMLMQALNQGQNQTNPMVNTNTNTSNLYLPMNAPGPRFGGGSQLDFGASDMMVPTTFPSNYTFGA